MRIFSQYDLDQENPMFKRLTALLQRDYNSVERRQEYKEEYRHGYKVDVMRTVKYYDLDYIIADIEKRIKLGTNRVLRYKLQWEEYLRMLKEIKL